MGGGSRALRGEAVGDGDASDWREPGLDAPAPAPAPAPLSATIRLICSGLRFGSGGVKGEMEMAVTEALCAW